MHRLMVYFFSYRGIKQIVRFGWKVLRYFQLSITGGKNIDEQIYDKWLRKKMPSEKDFKSYIKTIPSFNLKPLVSVVMPVYNPQLDHLKAAVESVESQIYNEYELCIADDASTKPEIREYLGNLSSSNPKIKVVFRKENGHISKCSNDALTMATGQFIAFLDQDDLLTVDALYQFVKLLNEAPHFDIAYSDEDKITDDGTCLMPHFKPGYSPDNLMSRNYFGHLVFIRKTLLDEIDGFRVGFEGSQDYDLWLRATEKANGIIRIPKILYHWRMHEMSSSMNESAKDYAFVNGKKALEEAIQRRSLNATVERQGNLPGFYRILYKNDKNPKISIIIPTKDNADVLNTCLNSIFNKTDYSNFEVILVNNNSELPETFELLEKFKKLEPNRFKVLDQTYAFNFSKLMNAAAKFSEGQFLLLLNNDTEVLHTDWLELMLRHAQRPEIGAVGVKLLFPNDTIQHAGVVIGIGGVAGHTFVAANRKDPGYHYYLTSVSNYSAVTAACLMVDKLKYEEVNGFDEHLEVEYNDVDFCLKLLEKGYYNIFLPDVELYHYESLTRGHPHANRKVYKRHKKEVKIFLDRWRGYVDNDPFYNPNLSKVYTNFDPNI